MGFWFMLILWAATFAVQQLMTPKPEFEDAVAAGLDDFNFPTTTEGRIQPLHWGTDKIAGPNVLWYGGLRVVPIVEKQDAGMFNTKRVTVGHKYYVGFQLGICIGTAALRKIWIGDELVWSGNQTTDGDISINHKDAKGTFGFYTGSKTQAVDSYLAQHQSPTPAYRGMCYGVFKGGYIGDNNQVRPWAFEVTRIPTGLGTTHPTVNSLDCNPMEMMYDLLTHPRDGYGYPDSDINMAELRTAGETLYNEGNGISYTMNTKRKITVAIKAIEKQCDCRFRIDPQTGQWRVVLVRDGYSIPGLRDLDEDNILEVIDFSRAAWDQTVNHVRVNYKRRANYYSTSYAPAQDGANMRIQGRVVPVVMAFDGVKDDALANKISWRELRSQSYPLSKGRFKVNRTYWDAHEAEVVMLNYTIGQITITDMPMRITRIDVGNKEEPDIIIDVVQDIFSWRAASFADPDASSWNAPDKDVTPFPSTDQLAFEAPYAISRRHTTPAEGRIWCSGASQGREETGFRIRQRNASGTPAGNFFDAGDSAGFMYIGELDGAIVNNDTTIDILTELDITEILEVTAFDVGTNLTNLIMIGSEFVACTGVSAITGGLRLTGCYRGLLDSAEASHADAADVYFINVGGVLTDTAFNITHNVHIRLLPFDAHDNIISESDGLLTQLEIAMASRERRPYPPTNLELATVIYNTGTVSLDTQHGSNEDDKGIVVEWNRRDYRILDEVSQLDADASTLVGDFPTNNTTEYAIEVWKDPDTTPVLLYSTAWADKVIDYAYRSTILRYLDGAIPSRLEIRIKVRHVHTAVTYEALQTLDWPFDSASTELSGDDNMGVLSDLEVSASWTAPENGTYACTLGHANSGGPIEYRLNGGGWSTAVATSATSGNITGATATDTIEVRSNGLTLTGVSETIMRINSPTLAEDGYAIFVP